MRGSASWRRASDARTSCGGDAAGAGEPASRICQAASDAVAHCARRRGLSAINDGARIGAVVTVSYQTAVDDPTRFHKSRDLGPYFGLTPSKYQSGEVDRTGRITKVGDVMVRTALFEAAHVILTRVTRFSTLKAWALRIAKQRGFKRAKVALARKLAVVLHRMWVDGTDFRWRKAAA